MSGLVVVLLGLGCGAPVPDVPAGPVEATVAPVSVQPLPGANRRTPKASWAADVDRYRGLLALNDRKVAALGEKRGAAVFSERAGLHFALYRLTGRDADFTSGLEAAAKAWETGKEQPGVRRAWADALQKQHRFAEALEVLEGLDAPGDRAARAAIRFELGTYEPAMAEIAALLEATGRLPDAGLAARLATMQWKLGRFEDAEASMALAQKAYKGADGWVRGWHHLLLGLMDLDRQRYDDALAHYRAADAAYPGWWLIEEHIAEIHLLQGRPAEALAIYDRVVPQTGSPELMGSRAEALEALGRKDDAEGLRAEARATFERQLAANPTAFGGHALEFLLEHGEPAKALELARANADLRPNGESLLLLADALEKSGSAGPAAELRAQVVASGWWVPPT
ncbi:MAG: tetratricopeptide repeat protein [Alphaproteobacteria bacterium]|nr:tetratricopeptide repeat protein [Alphaproteobacteria bacterium]